ncbi:unnamed protein product, partial [Rotaria sordida]
FHRIGAETTTGCLLAANALGKRDILASDVGIQATEELLKDLSHEACVDRYLEDQVTQKFDVNISRLPNAFAASKQPVVVSAPIL